MAVFWQRACHVRRLAAGLAELRSFEGNLVNASIENDVSWWGSLRFGVRLSLSLPFWGRTLRNVSISFDDSFQLARGEMIFLTSVSHSGKFVEMHLPWAC